MQIYRMGVRCRYGNPNDAGNSDTCQEHPALKRKKTRLFLQTYYSDPSNAKATFVQRTRMQRLLIPILTLSCWYSLDEYF